CAGMDEMARHGLVPHDARVILGIGGRRSGVPQVGQVSVTADVLNELLLLEPLCQDDEIDRLATVSHRDDATVDFLVCVCVEMIVADNLDDVADDRVVAKHATQDAAFGVARLRRQALRSSLLGWHDLPSWREIPSRLGLTFSPAVLLPAL